MEELLAADDRPSPLFDKPWLHLTGAVEEEPSPAVVVDARDDAIPSGDVLAGRFEILRPLARGGMGRVYEARDRARDTKIAIKVIDSALGSGAGIRERFRREVNLACRVTHPNVCRIFDLFEDRGLLFLTMELLRGESLADRLRSGALSELETRSITEQVAMALDAAHRAGVIHRDLKPGNVMIVPGGESGPRAVVTDFGLAIQSQPGEGETRPITRAGQVLGTLAFMSPEQLEGKPVTAATDLYALGLLVHQMLSGKLPFRAETPVSIALERLRERPPVAVPREIDRRWKRIIERCLERDPADRYPSAAAFLSDVRGDMPVAIPPSHRRTLRLRTAATVLAVLVFAAVAALFRIRSEDTPPAPQRRSPAIVSTGVLVTAFENRSGDSLLDGALEYALERELAGSTLFHIVPRERIQDVLVLMRKPPGTTIDATTGRDVALRDGDIDAVISGRIQKIGGRYAIHAEAIDPRSGRTLAAAASDARTEEEILPAVRQLADQLRATLGEELPSSPESESRLQRVTTPSLKALQLYSKADSLVAFRDNAAAAELLREAVAADPSFASAHMHLAWALRNHDRRESEYIPHARRAFELADTATERERYFIRGSYFLMLGRFNEAIASYKALLQIDPNHYWAVNNLSLILGLYTSRYEEAIPYGVRRADLRPHDIAANYYAAQALAIWAGRPADAAPYLKRGHDLLSAADFSPAPIRQVQFGTVWLDLYPLHELWMRDDVAAMARQLDARMTGMASSPGAGRDAAADAIGHLYLAIGKLRAAEAAFELISHPVWREGALLDVVLVRGDRAQVVPRLRRRASVPHRGSSTTAIELARNGLTAEARALIATPRERASPSFDPHIGAAQAELALAEGRTGQALPLLESAVRVQRPSGARAYFLASQSLARVWTARGDVERARAVLEDAFRQRRRSYPRSQPHWMAVASDLAQLYEETGRPRQAEAVRRELAAVLALADPDHPLRGRALTAAARSRSASQ